MRLVPCRDRHVVIWKRMWVAEQSQFSIAWRSIAFVSLLVNLGAVAIIATMAAVRDVGVLNTVALTLAVIVFVCQLIIYSIQTWQSGHRLQEARQLNVHTLSLLAEVRARIGGTPQVASSQYQEFIQLITLKAGPEIARSVNNIEATPTALEAVARTVRKIEDSANGTWWTQLPRTAPSSLLFKWPTSAEVAEESLRDLEFIHSNGLLGMFFLSVDDEISSAVRGVEGGLGHVPHVDEIMIQHELLQVCMSISGNHQIVVLTDKGRLAAANLLAPWPPPRSYGVQDRIHEILKNLDEETHELIRRLKRMRPNPR
jgi:hypothetical protein